MYTETFSSPQFLQLIRLIALLIDRLLIKHANLYRLHINKASVGLTKNYADLMTLTFGADRCF